MADWHELVHSTFPSTNIADHTLRNHPTQKRPTNPGMVLATWGCKGVGFDDYGTSKPTAKINTGYVKVKLYGYLICLFYSYLRPGSLANPRGNKCRAEVLVSGWRRWSCLSPSSRMVMNDATWLVQWEKWFWTWLQLQVQTRGGGEVQIHPHCELSIPKLHKIVNLQSGFLVRLVLAR